jgi:protein O-mannosyl-transferase
MARSYTRLLVGVALLVLTAAAFWQLQDNDFINFDDQQYLVENQALQDGVSYKGLVWAFTTTHNSNWHPLTWLSHLLDYQLYGLAPRGHHLTSLLFHLANVILLFLVLDRMTGALWPSAMVAALFALHPLHVESVAWASERKDVLSTFFWFLTLGAYVLYTERPGLGRYLLILLFFALGLMAKPMLVTLPFVLLLLDYWPLSRWPQTSNTAPSPRKGKKAAPATSRLLPVSRLVLEKVPCFILSGLSCLITLQAQQEALGHTPWGSRVANSLVAYGTYLVKTVWPSQLTVFYPYPTAGLPWWQVGGAALVLLSVSLLAFREARRRPYLLVGWFWFLGTLLPVIGLVQVGKQALADRYTYVPLIGLFIMGVWGTLDLTAGWRRGQVFRGLTAAIVISLAGFLTWQQVGLWRNSITLFQQAVKVTTDNYLAYYNLGVAYNEKGWGDEAIAMYKKAIECDPYYDKEFYGKAYYNLGIVYNGQGRVDEAIAMYEKAIETYPSFDKPYYNLGRAYEHEGLLDEAAQVFQKAIELNPSYKKAYNELAAVYQKQGDADKFIALLQQAIERIPDFAEAYNKLGLALGNQGRLDEAIAMFQKAAQLQPNSAIPYYNLGRAYTYLGRNDEAITMLQKAIEIKPDFSEARDMLKKLTGQ